MPENTSNTFLMYKSTAEATSYTKLCDIKDYPEFLKAPGKLDTTTLSDQQKTYIMDIPDVADMAFAINYNKTDYQTILALQGKQTLYEIQFGTNGADGKFDFTADTFFSPSAGKVGAVREGTITLYPSTPIVPSFTA